MQFKHRMLWCAFLAVVIAGCAGSESPAPAPQEPAAAPAAGGEGQAATAAPDTSTPDRAVTVFLDAVRRGDDQVASSMFTPLAREKTAELDIQVAPRGSDTARFEVGEVQYLDDAQTGARVKSAWTDIDAEGKPRTDDIMWMVRRESAGWRVAGLAAVVFDGRDPLVLDFEKPEETLRQLERVREEMQQQAATASAQAEPAAGTQTAAATLQTPIAPATATAVGNPAENSADSVRR